MRTLFFVIIFLCIGLVSFAHDIGPKEQIFTTEKGFALANTITSVQLQNDFSANYKFRHPRLNSTTGIHKFRNTKIKIALTFITSQNKPKLA